MVRRASVFTPRATLTGFVRPLPNSDRMQRMPKDAKDGPRFINDFVVWGETTAGPMVAVSRTSFEQARSLLRESSASIASQSESVGPQTDPTDTLTEDLLLSAIVESETQSTSDDDCPSFSVTGAKNHAVSESHSPIVPAKSKRDTKRHMQTGSSEIKRETMTVTEVAAEAGVTYRSVWRWIEKGKLPAQRTKVGRVRILRSEFRRFMGFKD